MTAPRAIPRVFISRRASYPDNLADSANVNAYPAALDGPNGHEPAVAVRTGSRVRLILTPGAAISLANDIADLLERMDAA